MSATAQADYLADRLLYEREAPGLAAEDRAKFERKRVVAAALAQIEHSDALTSPVDSGYGPYERVFPSEQEPSVSQGVLDGVDDVSREAERWDAQAEYDMGVFMRRYLAENPPPDEAACAEDFRRWSEDLRCDGQARLQELGVGRLRAL